MTRIHTYKIIGLAVTALSIASVASAAGPTEGDFKATYQMRVSEEATQWSTLGYVDIQRSMGVETFGIRIFGKYENGTVLIVEAETKAGRFEVGAIEMFLGSGSLRLSSGLLPSPVFPLLALHSVEVRDSGGRVVAALRFPDSAPQKPRR